MRGHEVYGVGGHELGRHRQIALVLAVLVVDEDDHPAGADVRDGSGDAFGQLGVDGAQRRGPGSEEDQTPGKEFKRAT